MRLVFIVAVVVLLVVLPACEKPPRQAGRSSAKSPDSAATAQGRGTVFAEGSPFTRFSLAAEGDKRVSLADYSGKLLLVNFWATWCAPCIAEMPALERLYQTYRERGLEVLAITVDAKDAWQDVRDFTKRTGLSFQIAYDPDLTLPPKLGITGFPETFFVGPDGTLLSFLDPDTKKSSTRVISDRPWDSPVFIKAVGALLDKHLPVDSDTH